MSNRELNAMAAWYSNFVKGHSPLYLRHQNSASAVAELVSNGYTPAALEHFELLPDANKADIAAMIFGMSQHNHYRFWTKRQWVQRANELLGPDCDQWTMKEAKHPVKFLQLQFSVLNAGVEAGCVYSCGYLLELHGWPQKHVTPH